MLQHLMKNERHLNERQHLMKNELKESDSDSLHSEKLRLRLQQLF